MPLDLKSLKEVSGYTQKFQGTPGDNRSLIGSKRIFSKADGSEMEAGEQVPVGWMVDVAFIDLRFSVNYALDELAGSLDPGMIVGTWSELHEHNAAEFQNFFGSLSVFHPI